MSLKTRVLEVVLEVLHKTSNHGQSEQNYTLTYLTCIIIFRVIAAVINSHVVEKVINPMCSIERTKNWRTVRSSMHCKDKPINYLIH